MQTDGKASHKNSTSEYLPLKHKIANLRNHNTISMKKALLTLLLATTTILSHAYNPIVRNFSKDVYKGGTQTWDIAQGEGGCMYFANNNGVLEFNGREWTLMRLRNYTSVRSLYYDRNEHALYAGGTNELGRFCCSPSGVKYESLLDSLNVSLTEIWDISRDAAGDLVFEDKSARYILRSGGMERSGIERKETGEVFCTAENDYFRAEGTTSDGVYIRPQWTIRPSATSNLSVADERSHCCRLYTTHLKLNPLLTNRVGKGLCYRMSVIYSMAGTSIWEP